MSTTVVSPVVIKDTSSANPQIVTQAPPVVMVAFTTMVV